MNTEQALADAEAEHVAATCAALAKYSGSSKSTMAMATYFSDLDKATDTHRAEVLRITEMRNV